MKKTIAVLVPDTDADSPEWARLTRLALIRQIVLLSQGLPVQHPEVRKAAHLVASSSAPRPIEAYLPSTEEIEKQERLERSRRRFLHDVFSNQGGGRCETL